MSFFHLKLPLRVTFFLFYLFSIPAIAQHDEYQTVSALENAIIGKVKHVTENCNTKAQLKQGDFAALPVGIAPRGCDGTTIIVIDSAYRADRGGMFFSAYTSVVIPGTTKPIAFAGRNIGFNKGGLTLATQTRLVMVSPQRIKINENVILELPADGRNFIDFDCDGFKAINLKGSFIFSKDLLEPDTDLDKNATAVTASFEVNTHDLNDIMTSVNISPFKIGGLKDLSFEVQDAVVDYSDIINPEGFSFPQGYQQTYGESIQLWRGFYLRDLTVRVKSFSDSSTVQKPLVIKAQNVIIDDLGVSGLLSAINLLPLKEGSADGWPISIDRISVKLQLNQITAGSLEGFLGIPFLGSDTVAYAAMMEQEDNYMNYRFLVGLTDSVKFRTPLSATVTVNKGSVITLEKRGDGNIIPSAVLHGKISIDGKVKAKDIKFENLELTTREPYILSGTFSTVGNGQSSGGGFPIQITDIGLKVYQGQVALGVEAALNFMNKEDKGFSGSTRFDMLARMEQKEEVTVVGELTKTKTTHHWEFERVKVGMINLDVKVLAFGLKGQLEVFDADPVYGDGFHGNVVFTLKKVLENGVKVNAYFGSKDTFRYWHVDGYVPVGSIPIPPVMAITGFMGGASYKMVRQEPLVPDFSQLSEEAAAKISTGTNLQPSIYIPDESVGLGFLAGVTLVVANENAINADVMLEAVFNQGGGMKYIRFDGSAFFMTAIKYRGRMKNGEAPPSPVYANMIMLYDNDNDVFHANMKTYMNVKGGLTGVNANGLLGEAVIHVDRNDWYTYIGRPSAMFGVNVFGLATAQTYFMVGSKIESLASPPPEVREIFGDIDLSLMRDDVATAGGKGFATGLHFKIAFDTEDKIKPFYVIAAVGAGTDIMLRNYGTAQCVGNDGPIGINGWYASGQAYAFLKGRVGIKVRKRSFDIVNLGLAALLQAKLPNPAWMRGMLAGRYKILGGLVKGKFNLKFTIGEECELLNQGEEIKDIIVIADLKPEHTGDAVNVFTAPQVSFNTAIGKDFSLMDFNDNLNSYRIALDHFKITKDGVVIPGVIRWNETADVAVLKTTDILPPLSNLNIEVKLHWEKKNSSGAWEAVVDNSNTVMYETKSTSFTTGAAPSFIPEENVAYSYPVNHQFNVYKDESGKGYVKLDYPQEYLFETTEVNATWDFIARFKDTKGNINEVSLNYSLNDAKINFDFPELEKQGIYTLTFIKRPRGGGAIDDNVKRTDVTVSEQGENEVTLSSNTLEGTVTQNVETTIYSSIFRASQFNTFHDKWAALGNGNDAFDVAIGNVAVIGKRSNTTEIFDAFELEGKEDMKPLVDIVASPDNAWLKNVISPLMYDLYPYDNDIEIEWRSPEGLGVKPLKGVRLTNNTTNPVLNDNHVSLGSVPSTNGSVTMGYYLSYYVFWDYNDLINQASAKYYDNWNSMPAGVKRLMSSTGYTDLLQGNYPVNVKYTLPGADKPNYETQVSIKF